MCGIIGFNLNSVSNLPFEVAKHRGPDATQTLQVDNFTFGHNRLSIIDLSPLANQPMVSSDGNYVIVFNGEVYNYQELRTRLNGKYNFKSNSDTEVILYSYIENGPDCLKDFIGMFSFSIYNKKEKTLFCAIDRLGIKPFHYYHSGNQFAFASEIKVIKSIINKDFKIDYCAITQYLHYNRIPYNKSIYTDIKKLHPGHYMIFSGEDIEITKYWDAESFIHKKLDLTENEIINHLDHLLNDSIRLRMIADVDLGVFLSGGLDSSVIAYYMSKNSNQPINSFTIGFENNDNYDERGDARLVAKLLNTTHREIIIKPNVAELLPKIVKQFDEPYGNSMALLSYELTKETRKHATVALAGDGGDEIFGGYYRYQALQYLQHFKYVPQSVGSIMSRIVGMCPDKMSSTHFVRRVKTFISAIGKEEHILYNDLKIYFTTQELNKLYKEKLIFKQTVADVYKSINHDDVILKSSVTDLKTFLPANLLVCSDRMSMLNSFELRVPLIDHRIVEFMSQIPTNYRIRNGNKKYILKQLMSNRLPERIINKPKWGFTAPLGSWLKEDLKGLIDQYLNKERIEERNIFNYTFIEKLIKEHMSGHRDRSSFIWNLLVLEEWFTQNQ